MCYVGVAWEARTAGMGATGGETVAEYNELLWGDHPMEARVDEIGDRIYHISMFMPTSRRRRG